MFAHKIGILEGSYSFSERDLTSSQGDLVLDGNRAVEEHWIRVGASQSKVVRVITANRGREAHSKLTERC